MIGGLQLLMNKEIKGESSDFEIGGKKNVNFLAFFQKFLLTSRGYSNILNEIKCLWSNG